MRVTVLGGGAWGTALASVLCCKGHDTLLWTWERAHAEAMQADRENRAFLPGVPLGEMPVTSQLEKACKHAELLTLVVPSHAVRSTLRGVRDHLAAGVPVVCATKGIEDETLQLMTEVIQEVLAVPSAQCAVLSGPSFAKEVAARVPTNLVAASNDADLALQVQDVFAIDWLRVYTSADPIGVEIGGALKNVIAIAAGAGDGLGLGANTRAALITRGIAEMARLSTAKGGERITMAGLAGIGDLVLTCTGDLSRNRTVGIKLGQGKSVQEALDTSAGVAEGYLTAKSAHLLARRLGVEMPITGAVYRVLHEGQSTQEAFESLLFRPLHGEWE